MSCEAAGIMRHSSPAEAVLWAGVFEPLQHADDPSSKLARAWRAGADTKRLVGRGHECTGQTAEVAAPACVGNAGLVQGLLGLQQASLAIVQAVVVSQRDKLHTGFPAGSQACLAQCQKCTAGGCMTAMPVQGQHASRGTHFSAGMFLGLILKLKALGSLRVSLVMAVSKLPATSGASGGQEASAKSLSPLRIGSRSPHTLLHPSAP